MSNTDRSGQGQQPAYREPWFWFLMAPLIFVVFLGAGLVSVAFIGADDRVYDDYYQQGRLINNRFALKEAAKTLALYGKLNFDTEVGEAWLELRGEAEPEQIYLQLSHPSEADMDHQLVMQRTTAGRYRTEFRRNYSGRWYVFLSVPADSPDGQWKVAFELDFAAGSAAGSAASFDSRTR